jgi:hypothetical protein
MTVFLHFHVFHVDHTYDFGGAITNASQAGQPCAPRIPVQESAKITVRKRAKGFLLMRLVLFLQTGRPFPSAFAAGHGAARAKRYPRRLCGTYRVLSEQATRAFGTDHRRRGGRPASTRDANRRRV